MLCKHRNKKLGMRVKPGAAKVSFPKNKKRKKK